MHTTQPKFFKYSDVTSQGTSTASLEYNTPIFCRRDEFNRWHCSELPEPLALALGLVYEDIYFETWYVKASFVNNTPADENGKCRRDIEQLRFAINSKRKQPCTDALRAYMEWCGETNHRVLMNKINSQSTRAALLNFACFIGAFVIMYYVICMVHDRVVDDTIKKSSFFQTIMLIQAITALFCICVDMVQRHCKHLYCFVHHLFFRRARPHPCRFQTGNPNKHYQLCPFT